MSDAGPSRVFRRAVVALLLVCAGRFAVGQAPSPARVLNGAGGVTIRISGVGPGWHGESPLLGVLTRLEADYASEHPGVRFAHQLNGNSSALGSLYIGAADLALMDREPTYLELDGYQQAIAG